MRFLIVFLFIMLSFITHGEEVQKISLTEAQNVDVRILSTLQQNSSEIIQFRYNYEEINNILHPRSWFSAITIFNRRYYLAIDSVDKDSEYSVIRMSNREDDFANSQAIKLAPWRNNRGVKITTFSHTIDHQNNKYLVFGEIIWFPRQGNDPRMPKCTMNYTVNRIFTNRIKIDDKNYRIFIARQWNSGRENRRTKVILLPYKDKKPDYTKMVHTYNKESLEINNAYYSINYDPKENTFLLDKEAGFPCKVEVQGFKNWHFNVLLEKDNKQLPLRFPCKEAIIPSGVYSFIGCDIYSLKHVAKLKIRPERGIAKEISTSKDKVIKLEIGDELNLEVVYSKTEAKEPTYYVKPYLSTNKGWEVVDARNSRNERPTYWLITKTMDNKILNRIRLIYRNGKIVENRLTFPKDHEEIKVEITIGDMPFKIISEELILKKTKEEIEAEKT